MLFLTFLVYMSYHLSRKAISVVKSSLNPKVRRRPPSVFNPDVQQRITRPFADPLSAWHARDRLAWDSRPCWLKKRPLSHAHASLPSNAPAADRGGLVGPAPPSVPRVQFNH